jgi:type IV pilus assembly protein PilA
MPRTAKGFTLIELMIVVAIIGILASLAIPNFLKFQAKAKQSEAKTNLKGIYTAEIAHFGEQNRYGNFDMVAWAPVGAKFLYGYSLNGAVGATDAEHKGATSVAGAVVWTAPGWDSTHFTSGAAGDISTAANADCWTINDVNELVNTQSGI